MAEQTQEHPHVWGKIGHVFQPSITDDTQVHEEYLNIDNGQVFSATRTRDDLVSVIDRVQAEAGLKGVNILEATQDQRNVFAAALKSDSEWFNHFSNILNFFDVDADPKQVVQHLNRPWWNALQVNIANDSYSSEKGYSFEGKISHSFIAQLGDAGARTRGVPRFDIQKKFQPLSVGNLLFTSDNKLVMGYRGGQNFPDVIHVMPVGSAEPHLDRGAAWGSYDKENLEELNFSPADYQKAELVAKTTELLIARGGWHYLVFKTKTQMTSQQVKNHWLTAVDRKEHDHLESYDANPTAILEMMKDKSWDVTKASPKSYATTTPENKGTWLPQCSVCVISSYVQELGRDFAEDAERYLGGHYDLTSCLKK